MNFNSSNKVIIKFLLILTAIMAFGMFCSFKINAQNADNRGFVTINNKKIELEIANDNETRAEGLMYRDSMADNQGMVFIFDRPDSVNFWMKNVKISLDMVFISRSKIVKIYKEVPICKCEPCEVYPSNIIVDTVIELKGGSCKKYNIQVGQKVKYSNNIQSQINNIYNLKR